MECCWAWIARCGEARVMFPLLSSGHFFWWENTEESDQTATNETTFFSLVYCVLTIPFPFMIRIYSVFSLSVCLTLTAAESLFCTDGKRLQCTVCGERKKLFPSFYFFIIYCQTFLCIRFQNSMVSRKSFIKSITSILNIWIEALWGVN